MNKIDIIVGLRALAEELQPFTQEVPSGGRVWNGTGYVKSEARQADPYALMWWGTLTETADLLDAQDGTLSAKQIEHLRNKLFGGMGSFNDYCIDANRFGDPAKAANQRLNEKRTKLFQLFC
jgi:hypothetical protein